MTPFIWTALVLLVIGAMFWTCRSSLEPFEDVKMRPWFGYEPGIYGPGWGRKGCSSDLSCTKVSN
jgi:hypothetical protein